GHMFLFLSAVSTRMRAGLPVMEVWRILKFFLLPLSTPTLTPLTDAALARPSSPFNHLHT
ncbi:hypothetical protein FRC19_007051, partial [Serendipita sp. 401]